MTIYDKSGGGRRGGGVTRQILLILVVLVLLVGGLFVASGAVPWFNPGTEYNNEDASGGPNPSGPVP